MLPKKMESLKEKLFSDKKIKEEEVEKVLEDLQDAEEETPKKVEKKNKRK